MFSPAIERALEVASLAHADQIRKNTEGVPYLVHPAHIAIMLARLGLDEASIQAGLLHDVVEDSEWTLEQIEAEFGSEVGALVADLSEDKSKTWAERKQWAIDHVPDMHERAVTVKAADKLHNLSCLLRDLRAASDPQEVWSQFKGGRERTLAMSSELVAALVPRLDARMADALERVMRDLNAL